MYLSKPFHVDKFWIVVDVADDYDVTIEDDVPLVVLHRFGHRLNHLETAFAEIDVHLTAKRLHRLTVLAEVFIPADTLHDVALIDAVVVLVVAASELPDGITKHLDFSILIDDDSFVVTLLMSAVISGIAFNHVAPKIFELAEYPRRDLTTLIAWFRSECDFSHNFKA